MSKRNLVIITKVILLYGLFFIGVKIFAMIQGAWLEANLLLCIPFVLLAGLGIYLHKSKKYSWFYILIGILLIGLTRYFEQEWAKAIQSYFS